MAAKMPAPTRGRLDTVEHRAQSWQQCANVWLDEPAVLQEVWNAADSPAEQQELADSTIDALRRTALHQACEGGCIAKVRWLITEAHADVNARTKVGQTPLHRACEYGHVDVAQALLDAGVDISAQDHCGITPLHLACAFNRMTTVELLLSLGADRIVACVKPCTLVGGSTIPAGLTPFDVARLRHHDEITSLFASQRLALKGGIAVRDGPTLWSAIKDMSKVPKEALVALLDSKHPKAASLSAYCFQWYMSDQAHGITAASRLQQQLQTASFLLDTPNLPHWPGLAWHVRSVELVITELPAELRPCPPFVTKVTFKDTQRLPDLLDVAGSSDEALFPGVTSVKLQHLAHAMMLLHMLPRLCPNLQVLELSDCDLQLLPVSLLACQQLSSIVVHDQVPLGSVPVELRHNSSRLLEYLRSMQLATHSVPVTHVKLILAGSGFEGKTALRRSLRAAATPTAFPLTHVPIADRTRGLHCSVWQIAGNKKWQDHFNALMQSTTTAAPASDCPPLSVLVYDLAGQTSYFSSHQSFVAAAGATQSLVLLAVNLCLWTPADRKRVKGWLRYLANTAPGCSVILVGTHADCLDIPMVDSAAGQPNCSAQQRMNKLISMAESWSRRRRSAAAQAITQLQQQVISGAVPNSIEVQQHLARLQVLRDHPLTLRGAACVDAINGRCEATVPVLEPLVSSNTQWVIGSMQLLIDLIVHETVSFAHMQSMIPAHWHAALSKAVSLGGEPSQLQQALDGDVFASVDRVAGVLNMPVADATAYCEFATSVGLLNTVSTPDGLFVLLSPELLAQHGTSLLLHVRYRLHFAALSAKLLEISVVHPSPGAPAAVLVVRSKAQCKQLLALHESVVSPPLEELREWKFDTKDSMMAFAQVLMQKYSTCPSIMRFFGLASARGYRLLRTGIIIDPASASLSALEELLMGPKPDEHAMQFMSSGIITPRLIDLLWSDLTPTQRQLLLATCLSMGTMLKLAAGSYLVPAMLPWQSPAALVGKRTIVVRNWFPGLCPQAPHVVRRRFRLTMLPLFLFSHLLAAVQQSFTLNPAILQRNALQVELGQEKILLMLRTETVDDLPTLFIPNAEQAECVHVVLQRPALVDILAWQEQTSSTMETPEWPGFLRILAAIRCMLVELWPGLLEVPDSHEFVPIVAFGQPTRMETLSQCKQRYPDFVPAAELVPPVPPVLPANDAPVVVVEPVPETDALMRELEAMAADGDLEVKSDADPSPVNIVLSAAGPTDQGQFITTCKYHVLSGLFSHPWQERDVKVDNRGLCLKLPTAVTWPMPYSLAGVSCQTEDQTKITRQGRRQRFVLWLTVEGTTKLGLSFKSPIERTQLVSAVERAATSVV